MKNIISAGVVSTALGLGLLVTAAPAQAATCTIDVPAQPTYSSGQVVGVGSVVKSGSGYCTLTVKIQYLANNNVWTSVATGTPVQAVNAGRTYGTASYGCPGQGQGQFRTIAYATDEQGVNALAQYSNPRTITNCVR